MVKPVPDGFNSVNCYMVVPNSVEALDFYQKAFGAEAGLRIPGMGGPDTTMHAEMRIGNSTIMLTDENPMWEKKGPKTLGGSAVTMHLYVNDVDASVQRAIDAGCTAKFPTMDSFWGDRFGMIEDPYGHQWGIATHKQDMTEAEILEGAKEWMKQMMEGGGCPE